MASFMGQDTLWLDITVWVDSPSLVSSLPGSRPSKRSHHRMQPPCDTVRVIPARLPFPFSAASDWAGKDLVMAPHRNADNTDNVLQIIQKVVATLATVDQVLL